MDFVSIQGIHYRVDIYDEGIFTPVQLTAGPTPFVTDEDASDDFFCPVRTQTGTLQVCTLKPDGNYITLDELLPANNIARPIRLINLDNSNAIEWQGFLSCEAYSQDYTGIPQILDLPLISVLEAMASVQLNQTRSNGLPMIRAAIKTAMDEMMLQSGMDFYTHVNYSATSYQIFNTYIDQTVFFERNEYNNENSTTYIVSGMSVKEVLEYLATYMGWTIRERGTKIYFSRLGDDIYTIEVAYSQFANQSSISQRADYVTKNLATDVVWMGTGHQRSIAAGAKSVEVVASLKKYELTLSIPDCPVGNLTEIYRQLWKYAGNGEWLYLLANRNANAYSNISVAYYSAQLRYSYFHFENYGTTTLAQVLSHMAVGQQSSARATINGGATDMYYWYAGAFLCRYDWENTGTATTHNTVDGLYCVFFPHSINYSSDSQYTDTDFDPYQVGAIFSIDSVLSYRCNSGYIKLLADAGTVFMWPSEDYSGADLIHSAQKTNQWYICIELQFGNQWWNGGGWQSSRCKFYSLMTENGFKGNWNSSMSIAETDGLLIPITQDMQGVVTFKIWPMASPTSFSESNTGVLEMSFASLEISHVVPASSKLTDRSENHYFRLLGTNFRDEISIGTNLVTYLNNLPSPSLVLAGTGPGQFMTAITYYLAGGTTELRRPEVDLLNRLAEYYQEARHRLELEMAHIETPALPLLKLQGINDGKVYMPLSESRDWQTDECKLTCFECPQQPAENQ